MYHLFPYFEFFYFRIFQILSSTGILDKILQFHLESINFPFSTQAVTAILATIFAIHRVSWKYVILYNKWIIKINQ